MDAIEKAKAALGKCHEYQSVTLTFSFISEALAALNALGDSVVVPRVASKEMSIAGLLAFSNEVAKTNSLSDFEPIDEADSEARKWFRAGRITHNSNETDAVYTAMIAAAEQESRNGS